MLTSSFIHIISAIKKTLPAVLAVLLLLAPVTPGISADKPKTAPAGETPVTDSLEKLYEDYETIDRRMEEIHRTLGTMPGAKEVFTPFTITVKKKPGFEVLFIEVRDNGAPLWNHIYTPIENNAMEKGGRHIFYKTEASSGKHTLDFSYQYAYPPGKTPVKKSSRWNITVEKEPVFIELLFEIQGDDIIIKAKKLYVIEEK